MDATYALDVSSGRSTKEMFLSIVVTSPVSLFLAAAVAALINYWRRLGKRRWFIPSHLLISENTRKWAVFLVFTMTCSELWTYLHAFTLSGDVRLTLDKNLAYVGEEVKLTCHVPAGPPIVWLTIRSNSSLNRDYVTCYNDGKTISGGVLGAATFTSCQANLMSGAYTVPVFARKSMEQYYTCQVYYRNSLESATRVVTATQSQLLRVYETASSSPTLYPEQLLFTDSDLFDVDCSSVFNDTHSYKILFACQGDEVMVREFIANKIAKIDTASKRWYDGSVNCAVLNHRLPSTATRGKLTINYLMASRNSTDKRTAERNISLSFSSKLSGCRRMHYKLPTNGVCNLITNTKLEMPDQLQWELNLSDAINLNCKSVSIMVIVSKVVDATYALDVSSGPSATEICLSFFVTLSVIAAFVAAVSLGYYRQRLGKCQWFLPRSVSTRQITAHNGMPTSQDWEVDKIIDNNCHTIYSTLEVRRSSEQDYSQFKVSPATRENHYMSLELEAQQSSVNDYSELKYSPGAFEPHYMSLNGKARSDGSSPYSILQSFSSVGYAAPDNNTAVSPPHSLAG